MRNSSNTTVSKREDERSRTQVLLDDQRSQLDRNRLGQFATPNELAVDITNYAVNLLDTTDPIRFLEPALGSGSFFSALLQVAGADRIRSAVGVELDQRFVKLSEKLWSDLGLAVVEGDFTRRYLEVRGFNLILANPPYVRHHHLDQLTKARLQHEVKQTCGLSINGLAGLYVYFMTLAHSSMAEDGIAAWLLPSEFMDVNYGSVLRNYLSRMVHLVRIHRFDPADPQFSDALVSSAVVVFRKSLPREDAKVLFTFGGTMANPVRTEEVPLVSLRQTRKWTSLSHPRKGARQNGSITIGDLFEVRRGLVTGANSYFIMSRRRARDLRLPDKFLRPILPSPRYLPADNVVESDDGHPALQPQLVVLDCALSEEQIRNRFPRLDEYLAAGIAQGVKDRYIPSRRSPWYRQERRVPAPYLSTYMGRLSRSGKPFRFIWNRSQAVATNVYLMLYPKPPLEELITDWRKAALIHECLNSVDTDELRAEGRVYGGGLYKIEPRELRRLSALMLIKRMPELSTVTEEVTASTLGEQLCLGIG